MTGAVQQKMRHVIQGSAHCALWETLNAKNAETMVEANAAQPKSRQHYLLPAYSMASKNPPTNLRTDTAQSIDKRRRLSQTSLSAALPLQANGAASCGLGRAQ